MTSCVLFIHPFLILPCSLLYSTMASVDFLAQEKIWFDKPLYDEAERCFYERMNGSSQPTQVPALSQRFSPTYSDLSCWTSHLRSKITPTVWTLFLDFILSKPTLLSKKQIANWYLISVLLLGSDLQHFFKIVLTWHKRVILNLPDLDQLDFKL